MFNTPIVNYLQDLVTREVLPGPFSHLTFNLIV